MSKLIIIRGNSGSGKTTVAKALQQKLGHNIMLISQDVIRRDILRVDDGLDTKALPLIKELILYGKNKCDIVILEGILSSNWYQTLFELVKFEFKDKIFAYYYDIPFEETIVRHQTKPNCNEFGENDMKLWWNETDFIKIIKEKVLTKDLSVDETVDIIIKDISER
ncbi:kinase [Clostridium sp. CTA-5]